jgi:dTDP-4-amino-4,6-dideoxygalactose transaminase
MYVQGKAESLEFADASMIKAHIATRGTGQDLAIEGGRPLRGEPFAPWPHLEREELDAVVAVLRSGRINYWTGEEGRQFEEEFGAFTGCRYAVAVSNGSVALELALRVLGIGPGDEVIVPSRTFVATAFCVALCGATPVFADIDRTSQNLTRDTVLPLLSPRTKAIIAVHLSGWPCDMEGILELAKDYGLRIIEDCAQAHGATYKGRPVGSMGDVAAFSFCQDKIMTTGGEGGMLTTNQERLWKLAWAYKDHGKSYDAVYRRDHPPGYRWLHESFGTNWRLTEMQSAMGRVLLRKLPWMVEKRRHHAAILREGFEKIPGLRVTTPPPEIRHSYYKYYVFLQKKDLRLGWDRERVQAAICAEGIPCFSGSSSEIYLEKAFPQEMRPREHLPNASELGESSLMFLVHPTLSEEDMMDTCSAVAKVMDAATVTDF